MADQSLGRLSVEIGGDTRGLEAAQRRTRASVDDMDRMFAGLRTRILATLAPLALVADTWSKFQDKLADASAFTKAQTATGLTAEELSKFKFIVERSGESFDSFSSVVEGTTKALEEAASDGLSEASQAFRQLGVSLKDSEGNIRGFADVFPEIVSKLGDFRDGANKTALAVATMGDGIKSFPQTLKDNADGFKSATDRAKELHAEMSQEQLTKYKAFQTAIFDMKTAWANLSNEFLAWIAGPAKSVADWFTAMIPKIRTLTDWIGGLFQNARIDMLRQELAGAEYDVANMTAEFQNATKAAEELGKEVDAGRGEPGLYSLTVAKLQEMEQNLERVKARAAEARANLDYVLNPPLRVVVDTPNRGGDKEADPLKDKKDAIKELKAELDQFMANYFGEVPWVQDWGLLLNTVGFKDAMDKIDAMYQKGALTAEEVTKRKAQLARQEQGYIYETAQMFGTTLTAVFGKSKAAAIAQSLINTSIGITKALAQVPWPYDLIQAGLIAAQGAAQVAAIRSQSETGGGAPPSTSSFSGGGGGGAGAGAGGGGGGGDSGQTLTVRGLDAQGLFSGDVVRDLASKLIDFQRDGGVVILDRA